MPGWKLRTTRALASGSRTESRTAARPPLSLARNVATSLTAPGQHANAAQLGCELAAPGAGLSGRPAGHLVSAFS